MSVATALLWADLVAVLDVPDIADETARVAALQTRRAENLVDIQACRRKITDAKSSAYHLHSIVVGTEENAVIEAWLDSVGAPYESEES